MTLDQNYSASTAEKDYIKSTLETEGVQELFKKEAQGLQSKIINNFHSANYVKLPSLDTHQMQEVIDSDPDMKAKYEAALAKNTSRGGFSKGILLLQTLAIKCITVLSNNEVVENKLQQRSELGHKSEAMDGILGPNTFYVLASIAKEKNIPFNGIVDQKLIDTIVDICLEDAMSKPEEQPATITSPIPEATQDKPIAPIENPANTTTETQNLPEKQEPNKQANTATDNNTQTSNKNTTPDTQPQTVPVSNTTEVHNTQTNNTTEIPVSMYGLDEIGKITSEDGGYSIDLDIPRKYDSFMEIDKHRINRIQDEGYEITYLSNTGDETISTIKIRETLEVFKEFESMQTDIKKNIDMLKIKYDQCNFLDIQNNKNISCRISYHDQEIIEIGIGIHEHKLQYFGTYGGKTEWSNKAFDLTAIIGYIDNKTQESGHKQEENTSDKKQTKERKNKRNNKKQKRLD